MGKAWTTLDMAGSFRGASQHQIRSFFNIVQKGGQTHVQKFWSKFCMILKAFWQHKIDIKRLEMSQNGSKMSKF